MKQIIFKFLLLTFITSFSYEVQAQTYVDITNNSGCAYDVSLYDAVGTLLAGPISMGPSGPPPTNFNIVCMSGRVSYIIINDFPPSLCPMTLTVPLGSTTGQTCGGPCTNCGCMASLSVDTNYTQNTPACSPAWLRDFLTIVLN